MVRDLGNQGQPRFEARSAVSTVWVRRGRKKSFNLVFVGIG
jgi:hypothetical protein